MRRFFAMSVVVSLGLLAGCTGGPPPGGIAALDGAYEGEMTRSAGPALNCPAVYRMRLTVARGEVRGEVFDPRQPDVPADRFAAFVEADGRMVTALRVGGLSFGLRGRFGTNAFVGSADGQVCGLSVNAARRP